MDNNTKVAIVTGASSGIGKSVAEILAKNNLTTILVARDRTKLEQVSRKINKPGKVIIAPTDVRQWKKVQKTVENITDQFGRIDILINCAGVSIHGPLEDIEEKDWNEVIDTNLKGTFIFSRAVWPLMKKKKAGHIVTISSASGLSGYPWGSIYCASKFGVVGLMETLAAEGQELGIKVTNICPGQVDTNIWSKDDPIVNKARTKMLKPEAIADLVYFIISQPNNVHFRQVIVHPFEIQPYLRGRNRGPSGKHYTASNTDNKKVFRI